MPRQRLRDPVSQIQSLDRALAALELFTPHRPFLTLGEAVNLLGVGKSTIHRLFTTLVARGYLSYNPHLREYRLGLAAVRLGNVAVSGLDLRRVGWPHLRRLQEETGESTFLLVEDRNSAVVIDWVESGHALKLTYRAGLPWPLHAGASNKVLLAFMPEERRERYLSRPLDRVTERTQTDPALLRLELARIREQGYAGTAGELSPDVAAFCVPILDGRELIGALAVAGPTTRMEGQFHMIQALQRSAREIARELGSRVSLQ